MKEKIFKLKLKGFCLQLELCLKVNRHMCQNKCLSLLKEGSRLTNYQYLSVNFSLIKISIRIDIINQNYYYKKITKEISGYY